MMLKKLSIFAGVTVCTAVYLTFLSIFLLAFSSPSKAVVVTINQHGEANLELFILLTTFIPVVLMVNSVIDYLAKKEAARK